MSRRSFLDWITSTDWKIWLLFFMYPLIVGLLVQFVVLPHLFPSLHAGEGLMQGGDWLYFHRLAKDLAERIRADGWRAWELRPKGQAPAGIAAVFYSLFVPKPWVLLPFNACVHAFGGLALFYLMRDIIKEAKIAFFSALPFVFFPSAMNWYAQMHKDGIFALGVLLFLLGWERLFQDDTKRLQSLLLSLGLVLLGALVVWVVRPYAVEILWFLSLVLALVCSVIGVFAWKKSKGCLMLLSFVWLAVFGLQSVAYLEKPLEKPFTHPWYYTRWIPDFVENKLRGLAEVREAYRFIDPDAMGNIDWDVTFHSASDVIQYVPRALIVGFLAPFPRHWFQEGTSPGGALKRRICGFEMSLFYLSLPFLLLLFRHLWKSTSFWALLFFCLSMVLIYALAFPNLGPLYRERYAFLMVILALGIAGLCFWFPSCQTFRVGARSSAGKDCSRWPTVV